MRAFALVLLLAIAHSAHSTVLPFGIQSDYSKSTVAAEGWTIAYQGGYGTTFNYANVLAGFGKGAQVALASASSANSLDFDLFAATTVEMLLRITAKNTTFKDNGVDWYRNNSSLGFAPDSQILQNSADVIDSALSNTGSGGDFRLSWHTDPGGIVEGGWRSGSNTHLNGNNIWQRYILVSTASIKSVPEPGILALMGLGLLGFGVSRRNQKKN